MINPYFLFALWDPDVLTMNTHFEADSERNLKDSQLFKITLKLID